MNAVNRNEIDFNAITKLILQDMTLTYFLLRLINSPAFGMVKKVSSVKHALVILGEKEIKKWISLIILSVVGKDNPSELIRMSLLRARLAEQLAKKTALRASSEHFFLAGLFSMLDVILDRPFEQIIEQIYLPDSVKNYFLNEPSYLSPVMKLVIAYEQGDWDQVFDLARILSIGQIEMIESYQNALKWQNDLKLV